MRRKGPGNYAHRRGWKWSDFPPRLYKKITCQARKFGLHNDEYVEAILQPGPRQVAERICEAAGTLRRRPTK